MIFLRAEYDEAVSEGVRFLWNTSITRVYDDRRLTAVTDGEERQLAPGKLMMAVGSRPASRIVSTTTGIDVDENGFVITREVPFGMTTRKGVFAGGDVSGNQATVVHAMSNARAVAQGIAQYIDALTLLRIINE